MSLYEVYIKGSQLIEADSEDEARQVYVDLVCSEVTSEFIFCEEVEDTRGEDALRTVFEGIYPSPYAGRVEWNSVRDRYIPRSSDYCVREAADEYQQEWEKYKSAQLGSIT